jgi:hypothetical protein
MTQHVVMFSGGIGSWAAAKRVAQKHGIADLTLLFTDTLIEDVDLYRFLEDAAANVGGKLVRIAEGRTPWEVFRAEKTIGNTRVDVCSRILKRRLGDKWLKANCKPDETVVYLGIDLMEVHRFDDGHGRGAKHRYARNGWQAAAPLCDMPFIDKPDMLEWARLEGLQPSRAYAQGFAHDNCGGFCIKAGIGHFAVLLRERPEVYAMHEAEEESFPYNKDKEARTILRDRTGETTKPLSLRELREQIQSGRQVDLYDIGGCGCFVG